MTRDAITIPTYSKPGPHVSHAVRVPPGTGLVFLTGITARGQGDELVGVGNIDAQVRHVFGVIREMLAAAGSSMEDVVTVTTYVTEVDHLPRAVEIRREFFQPPMPATTGIIVKALRDPRMLVEITVVAMMSGPAK
jgi:enamine deaminase RidA (YjgF/YER057c/UK114 family)